MSTGTATAAASALDKSASVVLTVTPAGAVASLVEADDELRAAFEAKRDAFSIDDVWPEPMTAQIRALLQRAVRSRRSCSEEIDNPSDGVAYECIAVPQGPERGLIIMRDVSDQKAALSRVNRLAYTDEATGLPNREFLFRELTQITEMQRLKEGRAAMICLHVGQFDENGYSLNSAQQDEVLHELAVRLTAHVRGSNDEDESDYERYSVVARMDYRQFGIVLPSIESGEDAETVVERLVHELRQPVTLSNRTVTVRACGGVALFPQDGTDAASLFENAAMAMHDARNDRAASFKFHSGTVRLRTLQRQDLETELRAALDREEYALNYLPIFDATSKRPIVLEALLRWPDTVLGTQPTRKVVRVAERTGLIIPIGLWVIRRACEQLAAWQQAGHPEMRVAINLSAQQLGSDELVANIERIVSETGIRPDAIDVEIKEHMLFREVLKDYRTCRDLKALGTRLVVDDYGIGACSLAHLSQSPVDAIKIDNSLVSNLENSEADVAACRAAAAMARALGLDVIAEGVETEVQAEILRDAGCSYLQGFLYGRPMTEEAVPDFLTVGGSSNE